MLPASVAREGLCVAVSSASASEEAADAAAAAAHVLVPRNLASIASSAAAVRCDKSYQVSDYFSDDALQSTCGFVHVKFLCGHVELAVASKKAAARRTHRINLITFKFAAAFDGIIHSRSRNRHRRSRNWLISHRQARSSLLCGKLQASACKSCLCTPPVVRPTAQRNVGGSKLRPRDSHSFERAKVVSYDSVDRSSACSGGRYRLEAQRLDASFHLRALLASLTGYGGSQVARAGSVVVERYLNALAPAASDRAYSPASCARSCKPHDCCGGGIGAACGSLNGVVKLEQELARCCVVRMRGSTQRGCRCGNTIK